jgi:ABC-type transport system involved in cytochrome c biogenesis permease component
MNLLPIVTRELLVASRKRTTHRGRVVWGALGISCAAWILFVMQHAPPQRLGPALFGTMSALLFLFAIMSGVFLSAESLSSEKKQGTLGLLFLTDLKGYDIVLGKLAASSLNGVYGLLAIFPVMAISILLGGVTHAEFARVALVCLNLLFFSLCAGMFASALCRDERRAMGVCFFVLVLLCAATPVIWVSISWSDPNPPFWLLQFSPSFACFAAWDAAYAAVKNEFWTSVSMTHFYGWMLLGAAVILAPRTWQENERRGGFSRLFTLLNREQGNGSKQKAFRTRLLTANPVLWLSFRNPRKGWMPWMALTLLGLVWLWGWFRFGEDMFEPIVTIFSAVVIHTIWKIWLAGEATRRFLEDRQSGALELLLVTPLTVREILAGQQKALLRQFGPSVLAILAIDFGLFVSGIEETSSDAEGFFVWFTVWLTLAGFFVFDLFTLSWVGMWTGLTGKSPSRAASTAYFYILALPWLVYFLAATGIGALAFFGTSDVGFTFFLLLWIGIAGGINLFFYSVASSRLTADLRSIAAGQFQGSIMLGRGK